MSDRYATQSGRATGIRYRDLIDRGDCPFTDGRCQGKQSVKKLRELLERVWPLLIWAVKKSSTRRAALGVGVKSAAGWTSREVGRITSSSPLIRKFSGEGEYPYFLQEWGRHTWNVADASPISRVDARRATTLALAELDAGFFRVRFDRLTPTEKRYLWAMAGLGPRPHRSGDIAAQLEKCVTSVAPVRNELIAKGMIYSPAHGDMAFTAPLFDGFMKRIMPDLTR